MKFKKPQTKDVSTGIAQVAGASVGLLLPNGFANSFAKVDDEALITEDQKKKKMYANLAMVAVGVIGVLSIDGNDVIATGAKALSIGIAGGAMAGIIKPLLSKEVAKVDPTTTAGRLLRGSLGCPDMMANNRTHYSMLQMPMLRMPERVTEYNSQPALESKSGYDPLG